MSELLDELKREIAEQRASDAATDERLERIRLLMVRIRIEDAMKLPDLEAEIERFWDRATISRKTSIDVAAAKAKTEGSAH